MMVRIILLEVQDILDLCTSEGIDRLRVISHDTQILMELAELLQDQILGEVGILILIDHDISEPSRYRFESSRVIPQQYIHIQQDIIEIHDSGLPAFGGIQLIDVAYPRFPGRGIVLQDIGISPVRICRDQIVPVSYTHLTLPTSDLV